jgi:hypothetical protein
MLKVSTRYQRLKSKVDKIQQAILALQNECTHPNASRESKSFTGSYTESDSYWYEFRCLDFQKFWRKDQ